MPSFKVTIHRSFRIQAPVASRAQRVSLGNAVIAVVVKRIKSGKDATDQTAKPLSTSRAIQKRGRDNWSYAIVKAQTLHKQAIRDWTVTGVMLASLRVTVATSTRILIAPSGQHKAGAGGTISNVALLAKQQALSEMFGISANDAREIQRMVDKLAAYMTKRMVVPVSAFEAGGFRTSSIGGEFL